MQSPFGPVETSLLLRDILHHKDTFKSQYKGSASSGDSIKDIYGTDCNAEMISPLLHSKSSDMAYNARDNDNDLDNENEDMETATDNNSCGNDEDQSDDLDDRSLDASAQEDGLKIENGSLSLAESKEAKRAHVENILTSMKQSPHADTMDSSTGAVSGDVKRQKRKQPQPQQHESSSLHSEELALQKQIQQLQEQMQAVKRKREEDLSMRSGDDDDDTEEEGGSKPSSPISGGGGEFKRARVEHILSSMRSSTSPRIENGYEHGSRVSPGSDSGKRQKRKQTQPQQHEHSKSDYKDGGGITFKHNNNNNHGFSSKNFTANEDGIGNEDSTRENNPSGFLGGSALFSSSLYRGLAQKDYIPDFHNGFDPNFYSDNLLRHSFFIRPDLDPMAAFRNMSKALNPRGDLAAIPGVQPKPAPVDLSKIAIALKTELAQAVNKAIDSAVNKVFNEKQTANPESSMTSESSSQTQQEVHQHHSNQPSHHNHHHHQQQQQQQQQHQPQQQAKHHQSPGLLPHFMHQQHHQQMHHHRHQHQQQQQQQQQLSSSHVTDRDTSKETVNNSQGEKKPELIVPIAPFSDHLHFLQRFKNQLQQDKLSAFEPLHKGESELITPHTGPSMPFHPHFPYYLPTQMLPPLYTGEPEQTEALPLIVNTQKKKRTKVTDTRLSPRGKQSLLQDTTTSSSMDHTDAQRHLTSAFPNFLPPILPTSVAITNPSLSHASELLQLRLREAHFVDSRIPSPQDHSRNSPPSASDSPHFMGNYNERNMSFSDDMMDGSNQGGSLMTTTLTPMHLRKAKLMFFYTRYPSSSILKMYFPDVNFNKNNTAQLVKWFSNFREFFYIQMEKYARQALAEGCKHADDLVVTTDSELFRHLNLHYNRNNQIEVPQNFLAAVQAALKEFFKSIQCTKDVEPSWKKAIYKIIARMDETLPDFFKSPNWMEQLGDQ